MSRAGLNAASGYKLELLTESGKMYDDFLEESMRFQSQTDALTLAASQQNETFTQLQTSLDAAKAKMAGDSVSTSSLGAYSVAAKRQMQETNRMLAQLRGTKAPELAEIDATFVDPVTGKRVGQDAEFVASGEDIGANVRTMIQTDFRERTAAIESQLLEQIETKFGASREKVMELVSSEDLQQMQRMTDNYFERFKQLTTGDQALREDIAHHMLGGSPEDIMVGDGWTMSNFMKHMTAVNQYQASSVFAESRALAEMAGFEEGFGITGRIIGGSDTVYTTGSQAFMTADRDAVLEQMIADTTVQYEIQGYKDQQALESEFNRRKSMAASAASDAERRNQLIKSRAETIKSQEIQYERLLKQQQQEYQSTLSSAGAVETPGGGVTFTDIRPA